MTIKQFDYARVTLISSAHFIHDLYTSFLAPLLPLIIEKLSLTLGQAGLLSTVMQIPAFANPLIGLFADNRGVARWLVILAPSLTAIPMSLIGVAPSYAVLLILAFITGISVALFHVPAPVLVARYSGDFKGRGMSFFMAGGELSRSLGPMAAVGAVALLGLDQFHWVMVLAMLTSILLWFNLEKAEQVRRHRKSGSLKAAYLEIRHVFLPLVGILTARSCMHGSLGMFLTVYVEKTTGNLWYGGAALTLYEAFGVLGILSAGILSDRLGRQRVLFWMLTIAPIAILLFVLASGLLKIVMLLVAGFTVLSTTPVMLALIQETARENPSAANGLFMMSSFAVRSVAVVVAGVLGDAYGLDNMFIIAALAGVCGIPFLLKLKSAIPMETRES